MKTHHLFETDLDEEAVFSSWIEDLEFDKNSSSIDMELKNGRVYTIYNVPESLYHDWMQAPSKGKFWHSDVRGMYTVF